MQICQSDFEIEFSLSGACGSCGRSFESRNKYGMKDVVPRGLCPFAYYSIIPYWISFKQSAWFRWRENKNDVVCQCPREKGVVFLVRRVGRAPDVEIEAAVVSEGNPACLYMHQKGQVFKIQNEILCPALFPSLWSQFERLAGGSLSGAKIDCVLSGLADVRARKKNHE